MKGRQYWIMTSNNFKQELLRIENELRCIDKNRQIYSKSRRDVMIELYCLMHSNQSVRYFMSIFQRTGAQNTYVAKDIEDYISEVWTVANDYYDPDKGSLLPFLTMRLQNRIIDDERKMGGFIGLPRNSTERARLHLVSVDQESDTSGIQPIKGENEILDDYSYRMFSDEELFETEHKDLLISDYLHSLSAMILYYAKKYPVRRWYELGNELNQNGMIRKRKKYFYYRLFYSSDIIGLIKENRSTVGFRYEREAMDAMHLDFTNFCTDRRAPYMNHIEITPIAILMRPLARVCDVLPVNNSAARNNSRLSIPIQNEVVRGYMERIESVQISSSNISQMKHKYRCDVHDLFVIR